MATAVGAVASAVQGLLVARWLGPRSFGVASLIIAYPSVLFSFFDARSDVTTIKFVGEFRDQGDNRRALAVCRLGYGVDVVIALATFAVTFVTAGWAEAHLVHTSGTADLLVLYAAALVPNALATTSIAALTVLGRFKLQAVVSATVALARFALVVAFVALDQSVGSVIAGYAVSFLVEGSVTAVVAERALRAELGASWLSVRVAALRGQVRRVAGFLTFTNLTELMTLAYKQLDVVILGLASGPRDVGLYRLAKASTSVLTLPITPLISVTYQRMVSVSSHALRIWNLARRVAVSVALPLSLAVLVGGTALTGVTLWLAGPGYRAALPAILIWATAHALWSALFWLRPFYYANGWPRQWFALNGIGVVGFFLATIPFFAGGGFVSLTMARCAPLVVTYVGGAAVAARLWRRRAAGGWLSQAGRPMWLEWGAAGRVKMFSTVTPEHARFVTEIAALPPVAPYFPRAWVGSRPDTVAVEWVAGRRKGRLSPDEVAAVSRFQAELHAQTVPSLPVGFDYVELMVGRFAAVRDQLPSTLRERGDEVLAVLRSSPGVVGLSYPDFQPDNLVWSDGRFKVIDLELLTANDCFGVDLINTCASYGWGEEEVETYVRAYAAAGGNLASLAAAWPRCEALWKLRVVGNALQQGQLEQAEACLGDEEYGEDRRSPIEQRLREVIRGEGRRL